MTAVAKIQPTAIVPAGDPLDTLLERAIDKGAVDALERLLEVRRQVQKDRARDAFYSALIAFQTACPVISKDTTVQIRPGFSYRYTPLEDIAHAIRPMLEQFQLGYRWFVTQAGNQLTATCRISHCDGHIEESSLTVPVGIDPQRPVWPVAQSLTYAKRYTLCNALGIVVGGEDDDAHEATTQSAQEAKTPKAEGTPKPSPAPPANGPIISEAQAKRLYAIAKSAGWPDDEIKQYILAMGYEHTKDIKRADYEAICKSLEGTPPAADLVPF